MNISLLPIMSLSYLFQFLDKSALGYTAIMGLRTDLSMTGSQYSWSSGIYYFGYLVASYPVAWLLVRLPVGKTIAASVYVVPSSEYPPNSTDRTESYLGRNSHVDGYLLQCSRATCDQILSWSHRSGHRSRIDSNRCNVVQTF